MDETDGRRYATITVTQDLRDSLRVAKAQQGATYDEYLKENLPVDT